MVRLALAGASCVFALVSLASASRAGEAEDADVEQALVSDVHRAPLPDGRLDYQRPVAFPTFTWMAAQLLPSPELVVGRQRRIDASGSVDASPSAAFGLRWQLTPALWSFGVHRSQSRWRYFVVDPLARHSGSLELSTSIEYIGGHVDRLLVRPGLRVYLPVLHKGEYLSTSFGTSVYSYNESLRVAYDVGAYILSGFLGFQVTVAPVHAPLAGILTLRLRYF